MWTTILFKVLTSKLVEDLIAKGINWLVEHKTAGIGKELANTIINGVARSEENPTTHEMFKDALEVLK